DTTPCAGVVNRPQHFRLTGVVCPGRAPALWPPLPCFGPPVVDSAGGRRPPGARPSVRRPGAPDHRSTARPQLPHNVSPARSTGTPGTTTRARRRRTGDGPSWVHGRGPYRVGSALASMDTGILLVHHEDLAVATDNLGARLVLQRPKGLADLHLALL